MRVLVVRTRPHLVFVTTSASFTDEETGSEGKVIARRHPASECRTW